MWNGTNQRGSGDPGIGLLWAPRGNLGWQVVLIKDRAHLIIRDADRDVFVEGNGIVAPIVVEDVEAHDFPFDYEIVERGHRIGVITAAADHAAELAPHLLDNEILLVDADAEADPGSSDEFGRELQPRAGRDIGTSTATTTTTTTTTAATSATAARCRRGRSRTASWCSRGPSSKDGHLTRGHP